MGTIVIFIGSLTKSSTIAWFMLCPGRAICWTKFTGEVVLRNICRARIIVVSLCTWLRSTNTEGVDSRVVVKCSLILISHMLYVLKWRKGYTYAMLNQSFHLHQHHWLQGYHHLQQLQHTQVQPEVVTEHTKPRYVNQHHLYILHTGRVKWASLCCCSLSPSN